MVEDPTAEAKQTKNASDSFADSLLARKKITKEALERAHRSSHQTQERLVTIISKLGLLPERDMVLELAAFYKTSIVTKDNFPEAPLFAESINRRFLLHHHILPVAEDEDGLAVAMVDPGDDAAIEAISFFSRRTIIRKVAALSDIKIAIEKLYYNETESRLNNTAIETATAHAANEDIDRLADLASDAPVIRMAHGLINRAVEVNASDIHLEPFVDRLRVRFRIDGVLHEQETLSIQTAAPIASRIKIMARLNISERRLPQDGSIRFAVRGKDIDVRVSTSPTTYGESIVLRILDRDHIALDFAALGFDDQIIAHIRALLHRPNGIILVTGPTGSGKTTTLYSALKELNTIDKKILTIEDPIEYQLDGINQQEVIPQIRRNFASALRSFLRQDPDIIMVGEIRDSETARMAVQSALTGHLILSTLHTNDAASAMTRLLDMGIEDYLLTSTVAGVIGQRLARKLCMKCRESSIPSSDFFAKIGGHISPNVGAKVYRAVGCPACHGTGYHGRTTIVELLTLSDSLRRLVLQKAESNALQQAALAQGMRTMLQHGVTKILSGETSLEEILRITQGA